MNKANARLYIPAVEALADGELQVSYSGDTWYDWRGGECDFCRPPEHFRRKPKPREFWIVEVDNPFNPGVPYQYPHTEYEKARRFAADVRGNVIHLREVEE